MSARERLRLDAMCRVKRGEMTVVSAAELMGVSVRQARRLWKRYRVSGDAGLVHGLRGRAGNRRLPQEQRDRIVKLHQERYRDFGPTLACEKLAEEGLEVGRKTLVAMLRERGLWERQRRRGRHRRRRPRRPCFGSMVQMDGSHHDWFEGRGRPCVLMVLIDDATNRTLARLYPGEDMAAAFDAFGRWARQHGLPRSVYVDRHSIYVNKEDPEALTQFGRAMKELGVELIPARSPQAKGRVERRHAVFQDRLVKELRLRRISDIEQANGLLAGTFLGELNRRYSVKAARDQDLHRPIESGMLRETLCVQERRVVGSDWCVRWRNQWLQIAAEHALLGLPGRQVLVREMADGAVRVEYQGRVLSTTTVDAKAPNPERRVVVNNIRWKPGPEHPWNREAAKGGRGGTPRSSPAPAPPARGLTAEKRDPKDRVTVLNGLRR